jgi:hypothetical protein
MAYIAFAPAEERATLLGLLARSDDPNLPSRETRPKRRA